MKPYRLMGLALLATVAWSCSDDDKDKGDVVIEDNKFEPIIITASEQSVIDNQNKFAFDLYNALPAGNAEGNQFISPLSVSYALCMVANGAAGNTLAEFEKALAPEGGNLDQVNAINRRMLDELPVADRKVKLSIANSMWFNNDFKVLPTFVDINSKTYDAEVANVDLYSDEGKDRINGWISEKTWGMIPDFYSESPKCQAVLTNATYFDGKWTAYFSESRTQRDLFTNVDGTKSDVKMMKNSMTIKYLELYGLKIGVLNYGNGAYRMVIMLPKDKKSTSPVKIDSEQWNEIAGKLRTEAVEIKVEVNMPKFELETEYNLNAALQSIGIKSMFEESSSDFSRLSNVKAYFDLVQNKSKIIVNESGTKAASVTSNKLVGSAETFNLILNRPFMYVIDETSTGAIVFIGSVNKL